MSEEDLDLSPPLTIESASLSALYQGLNNAQDGIALYAKTVSSINAEINRRFTGNVEAAYKAAGKEHGAVKGELHDGFSYKADVSKKVKWDQPKMKAIAADLEWAQIDHIFEIKFSVKETIFKALMPGPIVDSLTDAREVKYGDPKIELVAAE